MVVSMDNVIKATLFTWGITALGASIVFFFKSINQKTMQKTDCPHKDAV